MVPVFVIAAVSVFLSYHNALHRDVATLMGITKNMALAVLWGSGIPFKSHPGLGMCWFLISLFWADIILNGIHLCLSSKPVVRTFSSLYCQELVLRWESMVYGSHKTLM